jgi:signal transduction histidine kinase
MQRERRRYHELLGESLRLQDAERRRIGRELHDSTGQVLAALEINLSLLQRRATQLSPELQRLLGESAELARQCRATIRTTSYLLHPPLLEELGLAVALRWLADGFRERSAIELDVQVPVEFDRLPPDVELALFRVAQEALTNVQRHSSGRSASLSLERRGNEVRLSIADSGAGLGATAGSYGGPGVGLASMRERMAELGGELQIESDAAGTCITCVLPLLMLQRNIDLR